MSRFPSRKYIILQTSETGSINFSEVMETTGSTLRTNNDGSLTFVKYNRDSGSNYPSCIVNLTTKIPSPSAEYAPPHNPEGYEHSHLEITTILAGSDWISGSGT